MSDELARANAALSGGFIDASLVELAFGSNTVDDGIAARYLALPIVERPALSVYFDREFYVATNPDVQSSGVDPLLHFLDLGLTELRSPHPLVDVHYVISEDPFLLGEPPRIDALVEMLEYDLASPSPYLDLAYYGQELGPATPTRGLLRHFLTEGLAGGRRPNPYLDVSWYVARHEDLPRDLYAALRHFVMMGDPEGRAAGPTFDGRVYRSRYPDVLDANVPPLRHYLMNGRGEGRLAANDRTPLGGFAPPSLVLDIGQAFPVDPDVIEGIHEALRIRLATLRHQRKDAVDVAPVSVLRSTSPLDDLKDIAFSAVRNPRLSILIPVFNELDYTVACLLSLMRALPRCAFEVVIADDCSTDADVRALRHVANLVYVRQEANRGFLRNCNAAYRRCRGEYVLLLNNDTQVVGGALDALVDALDRDPAVAAVGPKLIYPDGRLQEAGCYIKPNGESGMVGLFQDPDEPGFSRDRDVAYCSGAALMLRRAMVGETLFDERFQPAYCEDADLCLRLHDAGHRVRLISSAVVVHHLSVSNNRESVARKLRMIVRNQQRLTERWGELLRRMDRVRTIAFYLPQFHPTPENDLWWGAGFTEWTNVAKARPSYVGHYQPHLPADLGFYDLRSADTLARQAQLAGRYGIDGFCVYYYRLGDRRVLSAPLEVMCAHPDIAFSFCLCWANENWTKHWDGGTREVLLEQNYDDVTIAAILDDVVRYAADPRAIRVNGKPLFLVYRPLLIPDCLAFSASCRAAFSSAGFPGVHLVYVESMEAVDRHIEPADLGFDACVEFPPQGRAVATRTQAGMLKPGWNGYRYDYPETVMSFINRESVPYVRYPAVFPSWDNTARQPLKGTSFDGASPESFRFFAEEKLDEIRALHMGDERLLFVNAWNEWAEGAHLEPDTGYGHRWLEALRDALDAKRYA